MKDKQTLCRRYFGITVVVCGASFCVLPAAAVTEEELSPEFIEFLGEGEKIDGVWVDPFDAEHEEQHSPDADDAQTEEERNE